MFQRQLLTTGGRQFRKTIDVSDDTFWDSTGCRSVAQNAAGMSPYSDGPIRGPASSSMSRNGLFERRLLQARAAAERNYHLFEKVRPW